MKLTAKRPFPLSPAKKLITGEPFTVSDELGQRLVERGDAVEVEAKTARPSKPSPTGKAKQSSSSRPARAPKRLASTKAEAEPAS